MFSFFSKRKQVQTTLVTDMHSHLLPAIDDGVKTLQESVDVIDQLLEMGYKKLVTTPHIMTDYYGNTYQTVQLAFDKFLPLLREKGYSLPFECAAEYYLDDNVYAAVNQKEKLMTFGQNHILFETNSVSEPLQLKEFVFALTLQGYKPILAHPERYQYMTLEKAEDLRNRGLLLQLNLLSLVGYYGPVIQRFAEKLVDRGWVDVVGSDCHNLDHAGWLKKVFHTRSYRKMQALPLLNYSI